MFQPMKLFALYSEYLLLTLKLFSSFHVKRKKDKESGAAAKADELIKTLDVTPLLMAADDDAAAYADLQRTWKESDMAAEEKSAIEARALSIPTTLLETCHAQIVKIHEFLPHCNTNITSDAKVGIHQLAGSARAAYQVRYLLVLLLKNVNFTQVVDSAFILCSTMYDAIMVLLNKRLSW